jgi:hypothetical protein
MINQLVISVHEAFCDAARRVSDNNNNNNNNNNSERSAMRSLPVWKRRRTDVWLSINGARSEENACRLMVHESSEKMLRCHDRKALLQFMVRHVLPLWAAFGDFVGESEESRDSFFYASMRDFRNHRTIQFHWIFCLLCMTDS